MMRKRLWGVLSGMVFLPPVLLMTGCEDGDSLPVKATPDAGGAAQSRAMAATGLVAGGAVMRSSRYRLIGSMTPGVADGTVGASPHFVLRSGLVGASQ